MAKQYKAELIIVFDAEDIFAFSGLVETDLPLIQFEKDILDNSETRLEAFLEKHLADSTVSFQGQVFRGHVGEEIIGFSKTNGVDLIIMGTHGYRGLEKMFMGSVTDRVLKLAPIPVLTMR